MHPESSEPRPTVTGDQALPIPAPVPGGARRYTIDRFHVAGFRYHDGPTLVHVLQVGEALDLVAEPENPYDPFAVSLRYLGAAVGYVPRTANRAISRLLRQGAPLRCRIVDADPLGAPWEAVKVEVFFEMAPLPTAAAAP